MRGRSKLGFSLMTPKYRNTQPACITRQEQTLFISAKISWTPEVMKPTANRFIWCVIRFVVQLWTHPWEMLGNLQPFSVCICICPGNAQCRVNFRDQVVFWVLLRNNQFILIRSNPWNVSVFPLKHRSCFYGNTPFDWKQLSDMRPIFQMKCAIELCMTIGWWLRPQKKKNRALPSLHVSANLYSPRIFCLPILPKHRGKMKIDLCFDTLC